MESEFTEFLLVSVGCFPTECSCFCCVVPKCEVSIWIDTMLEVETVSLFLF